MNGDSYSTRGMTYMTFMLIITGQDADCAGLPDSGRYGSSRDHYVSFAVSPYPHLLTNNGLRLPETIAVTETEITTEEEATGGARDPRGIEIQDRLVGSWRLIPIHRVETTERVNVRTATLVEIPAMIGVGRETVVTEGTEEIGEWRGAMLGGTTLIGHLAERETSSKAAATEVGVEEQ